jgi:hypothetical protein
VFLNTLPTHISTNLQTFRTLTHDFKTKISIMKLLFLIPLALVFSGHHPASESRTLATYYYYGISTAALPAQSGARQTILYTDIKVLNGEAGDMKIKSKEWKSLVKKNCENANGCDADLNYYQTLKEAQAAFGIFELKYFSDTTLYKTKKIDY